MKSFAPTLLFASGAAAAAIAAGSPHDSRATPSNANANSSSTSYLARFADTQIRRGVTKDYGYTNAVLHHGFELAYELGQNATLLSFYEDQMSIVQTDGSITDYDYTFHSLDEYRFGMSNLYWYNQTGDEKYKLAADQIRAMLELHPRTPSGGFWHRDPTYPDQVSVMDPIAYYIHMAFMWPTQSSTNQGLLLVM